MAIKYIIALIFQNLTACRCVILELACSIAEGASEDLVDQIFNLIKHAFQVI